MSEPSPPTHTKTSIWRKRLPLWPFLLVAITFIIAASPILRNFMYSYRYRGVRSRVASVEAEFRNIAVALESFRVRKGRLPTVREFYAGARMPPVPIPKDDPPIEFTLTSPVAHIAALPGDPFCDPPRQYHYFYWTVVKNAWLLASVGPNRKPDFFGGHDPLANARLFTEGIPDKLPPCSARLFLPEQKGGAPGMNGMLYDPVNGMLSRGDIIRTGP